ncbi:hypothetical protein HanPI659440_Chr05g0191131 [Helianthus annuus]|nr:hypothetical protein HanPI659440_Chr05g0191131 [Helianthus annuus]
MDKNLLKEFLRQCVDVDDAWNLVGCLDTHLERIVFVLYHFIIHVVVLCFKTLYLIL